MKFSWRNLIILTLSLVLSMLVISPVFSISWQETLALYGPSVVKIEVREGGQVWSSGSGFIIDDAGNILTNAHVVEDALADPSKTVWVITAFNGTNTEFKALIKDSDDDLDLALLNSEVRSSSPCILNFDDPTNLMQEILVTGYPLGKNFKATPGYVQAFQDIEGLGSMIDLSASVDFGNSGGPVFNNKGHVIGIVTAKIQGANFNLALPISDAKDFVSPQGKRSDFTFDSDPTGARLYVNGHYKGLLPLTFKLFARSYSFSLEKDGYERKTESRDLSKEQTKDLVFNLNPRVENKITVHIQSKPEGAKIFINNADLGNSPCTLEVEQGTKLRIKAKLAGYNDFYEEYVINSEVDKEIILTLKRFSLFGSTK